MPIDPSLRSGTESEKIQKENLKKIYMYIAIGAMILFTLWILYTLFSSQLDTDPAASIDIDPSLQEDSRGRTPSIPDTI